MFCRSLRCTKICKRAQKKKKNLSTSLKSNAYSRISFSLYSGADLTGTFSWNSNLGEVVVSNENVKEEQKSIVK